tara:strand:- start:212 stop:331 length:120 start_codon:yes stop_codon:yes gene_type:complete
MYNGSYLTGGAASFSPPLGYNGTTITEYKTTRLGMDNCN